MDQKTTDIKSSKIEIAKLILEIEDPELIRKIHEIILDESGEFWHSLSDDERAEIQLGISQLNKGERISFDEYINPKTLLGTWRLGDVETWGPGDLGTGRLGDWERSEVRGQKRNNNQ